MEAGWIPAYRQMYKSDHWLAPTPTDPANRRDAWCDLLQMATHKPRQTSDPSVNLERGQLVVSLRTLAKRWCWHYSTVNRFLKELKTRTAIETVSETALGTVYLVVNYDKFAVSSEAERNSERNTERNSGETAAKQEQEVKHSRQPLKHRPWRICPEDFEPTPKHFELALQLHVNVERELTAFREWEFKDPKTDANRAFSRWLRTAGEKSNGNGNGKSKQPQYHDLQGGML